MVRQLLRSPNLGTSSSSVRVVRPGGRLGDAESRARFLGTNSRVWREEMNKGTLKMVFSLVAPIPPCSQEEE